MLCVFLWIFLGVREVEMCVHTHVCVYVCMHIHMHVGTQVASGGVGGFFRGVHEAEIGYVCIRVWVYNMKET